MVPDTSSSRSRFEGFVSDCIEAECASILSVVVMLSGIRLGVTGGEIAIVWTGGVPSNGTPSHILEQTLHVGDLHLEM